MRYNNFLSFLVQSKAITPLAETTLKSDVYDVEPQRG